MSDKSDKPDKPPTRRSGEMAAAAYREKYDSVAENTLPLVQDLNDRLDRALEKVKGTSSPPNTERDPRREPEDDQRIPPTERPYESQGRIPRALPTRTIVVNGKHVVTTKVSLTFEDIARIAFLAEKPTITYRLPSGEEGILLPGDVIGINEGLVVNVTHPGGSR